MVQTKPAPIVGSGTSIVNYIYTVYKSGSTYYAQNNATGTVTSNAAFATLMNAILANNVSIFIKYAVYSLLATITITDTDVIITGDMPKIAKTGDFNGFTISAATNVRINNLECYQTDGFDNEMFRIVEGNDIWITHNVIHDCYNGVRTRCNTTTHAKSYNVHVNHNDIYAFTYSGIEWYNGCDSCESCYNTIHDSAAEGTECYAIATETIGEIDTTSPMVEHLRLDHNHIYNIDAHNGIDFHGGNDISISYNMIHDLTDTVDPHGVAIYAHNIADAATQTVVGTWNIVGNVIYDVSVGIRVEADETSAAAAIDGVIIANNNVSGWIFRGIAAVVSSNANASMRNVVISGNVVDRVYGSYQFSRGISATGGALSGTSYNCQIVGNTVWGTNGGGGAHKIEEGIMTTYWTSVNIQNNSIYDCDVAIYETNAVTPVIRNNVGFVTENGGTATLLSGNTSVNVTHGLSYTPTVDEISIVWAEDPTNAIADWWISGITSSIFVLNGANPGASNLDFGWSVRRI